LARPAGRRSPHAPGGRRRRASPGPGTRARTRRRRTRRRQRDDGRERKMSTQAIGLMSGTSADGIDAALVTIAEGDRLQITLDRFFTLPYPDALREFLFEAFADRLSVSRICLL